MGDYMAASRQKAGALMSTPPAHSATSTASITPIVSLLTGAVVWGLIWYPYRVLHQSGLPGLPATVLSYLVALLLGVVFLHGFVRRAWQSGAMDWKLVLIGLAGGGSNLGYVLATLQGEVMRVLLLFYLAPLWTVFLAWALLGERLNRAGGMVVCLSLAGAVTMLWRPESGLPWPESGAEWLGLGAGFLFALSNVMVRQTPHLAIEVKSLAVFLGAVVLGFLVWPFEETGAALPGYASLPMEVWLLLGLVGVVLMLVNLVVQFGLTHTAATQAIVIFLFELVVAAISSWWLANEIMGLQEWLGGGLIVAASLFSGKLAVEEKEV